MSNIEPDNYSQHWHATRIFNIATKAMTHACKRLREGRDARIQLARASRLRCIAAQEWDKAGAA